MQHTVLLPSSFIEIWIWCEWEQMVYCVQKSQSDVLRIMQEACDSLFAWASHEVFGHKPTLPNEYYKQHPLTIFVLAPEIAPNTEKKTPSRLFEEQRKPIVAFDVWSDPGDSPHCPLGMIKRYTWLIPWIWHVPYSWPSQLITGCLCRSKENSEENKKKNRLLCRPHSFYIDHECAMWLWKTVTWHIRSLTTSVVGDHSSNSIQVISCSYVFFISSWL